MRANPMLLSVEFHCHTIYSKDSLTKPEKLLEVCQQKGIDRVVITDHNTIAGALVARQIDPERVIIGEEIMTTQGELLAAFVKEEIPPGLSPEQAIARLREQRAFISVSHPFDRFRSGHWEESDLLNIIPLVDAIEIFNARCMSADFNDRARDFALQHNLAGTAGSDAHAAFEIGKATFSVAEFKDAAGLKQVIRQAHFQVSLSPAWVHFTSRYAVWRKKRAGEIP